jgi:UDP-4-amino-4,6-dideoxy-N-acetyl-beta-L-altrosamine transaminase
MNGEQSYIPYGRQWIDEEDIQAVVAVLRSERLTQGSRVEEFEKAFADYVGSRYAVAVNNGTAALQLACLAAGLGTGDEVITSPITFVASANCALYVGAKPGFVDIDPKTCNLDPLKLESYLEAKASESESDSRPAANKSRAVIPVHFAGLPCDMSKIYRIADKFNLVIIEDACHALGAEYRVPQSAAGGQRNREDEWIKVGSCVHSHMTVFSFHPVKHITTGEGGMVTTDNPEFADRMRMFRNHGITRDPNKFTVHRSPFIVQKQTTDNRQQITDNDFQRPTVNGQWYYEMQDLGYNYRITDIQCALGLSQLKKADLFIDVRRQIAARYQEELSTFSAVQLTQEPEHCRSSYHLFTIKIDFERIGKNRDEVMQDLSRAGIGTQVHYIPIPRHPYYQRLGFRKEDYPAAERFYRQCLSLPIYPGLKMHEVERVIKVLRETL